MDRRRLIGIMVAATLGVGLYGCNSGGTDKAGGRGEAKTITLTLANPDRDGTDVQEYVNAVQRLSSGRIRVNVQQFAHYLKTDRASSLLSDLRTGAADIVKIDARELDRTPVRAFDALAAPGLIDSLPLEQRVVAGPVARRMLSSVSSEGLVGLAVVPGELSKPVGVARPLVAAGDFTGARLDVTPSRVVSSTFHALGATPIAHLRGAVGKVDGVEKPLDAVGPPGVSPRAVAANVSLWPRSQVLLMSATRFSKLSAEQQRVLREAAVQAVSASVPRIQKDTGEAVRQLCANRVPLIQASTAQIAGLDRAFATVRASLHRDPATGTAIDAITAVKASMGAPRDSPSCAGAERAPTSTAATPLDGTWRHTVTKGELSPQERGEYLLANWGHFKLALHAGRFQWSGQDVPDKRPTKGTYTVQGQTVTLRPSFPDFVAGRTWTLRWSRYRDTLTLTRAPAAPALLVTHAWRRTGP